MMNSSTITSKTNPAANNQMADQIELIHQACRFNNAGAAYLASQDAGNGVKFLKKALMIMEGISREEESEDIIMASNDDEAQIPFVEIPGLEDSFYVYNRALVLDPSNDVELIDLIFMNAAILFNLALAFHQHGKVRCQAMKLRKALHLYDLAATLIGDVSFSSSHHGALLVAALNNQAHIHWELCNFQEACLLMDQVQVFSEQMPNLPMAEDPSSSAFSVALFDEIFLNITMAAQIPTTAPSA